MIKEWFVFGIVLELIATVLLGSAFYLEFKRPLEVCHNNIIVWIYKKIHGANAVDPGYPYRIIIFNYRLIAYILSFLGFIFMAAASLL